MKKPLRHLLLILLVGLLGFGLAWLERDRLVQRFLQPWVLAKATESFDAEVRLDHLEIDWDRVSLSGLEVLKPEAFECRVAAIDIRFRWLDLWRHQLAEVRVRQPEIVVWTGASKAAEEISPRSNALPSKAPLLIDSMVVEHGALRVIWRDDQVQVQQIAVRGQLGPDLFYEGSALVGSEPGVSFRIVMQGTWRDGLELTLEDLAWDDRSLLVQPLTLRPAELDRLGAEFALPQLADNEVAPLLRALGQNLPWPDDMHWWIEQPKASFTFDRGVISLHVTTADGMVEISGRRWPWEAVNLQCDGTATDGWTLSGSLQLAGASRLMLNGHWAASAFAGDWHVTALRPRELLQKLGISMPKELNRLAELQADGSLQANPGRVTLKNSHMTLHLREGLMLVADFAGRWQEQTLSLELGRVELKASSRSGSLASFSGQLGGRLAPAAWQGTFLAECNDPVGLAQAFDVLLPADFPALRETHLQGSWQWQDERLTLPKMTVRSAFEGQGLAARLDADLRVRWTSAGGLHAELARSALTEVEYSNTGGTVVVVGGQVILSGSLSRVNGDVEFNLRGKAGVAEALIGSWYADLRALPLSFVIPGHWQSSEKRLAVRDASFDLAGLLHAQASVHGVAELFTLEGQFETTALGGPFQAELQRLSGDLVPGIKQLSLGGLLRGKFRVDHLAAIRRYRLTLQPDDVTARWGETFQVAGLTGDIPMLVGPGDWDDVAEQVGHLTWTSLQGDLFRSGRNEMKFTVAPNRWRLTAPVAIDVAGGQVRMNDLKIELHDLEPAVQASLKVADIELVKVSKAFGGPEIGGLLSANLSEIHISRALVRTGGEATMRAFGGDFRIDNMRIEAPLSRFPTYHADVDFAGLDLYELTRTFAFGEINGIADGYVHGLRLFNGIPSAFDAKFETREKGTRNISVKAIRNLNTLSQGGLSAALSQGIYKFIDFYRYRKIGILCSLENDVFHLKGIARDDSDQYLVYGGWLPPKIDVIVSSPTISFKEMVGRLKRIERAEH